MGFPGRGRNRRCLRGVNNLSFSTVLNYRQYIKMGKEKRREDSVVVLAYGWRAQLSMEWNISPLRISTGRLDKPALCYWNHYFNLHFRQFNEKECADGLCTCL